MRNNIDDETIREVMRIIGRKGGLIGGKLSKRAITPEQQAAMQAARKAKRKEVGI